MKSSNPMKEIIDWLIGFEHGASVFYRKASEYFASEPYNDRWLSKLCERLSEDEIYHAYIIEKASDHFKDEDEHSNLLELDLKSKKKIEYSFAECEAHMKSGSLTKNEFLETIIKAEYSEWNTYLIYIVNSLEDVRGEFKNVSREMQVHKDRISDYIKGMDSDDPDHDIADLLVKLSAVPDLWKEKFLLAVDDSSIILDLLTSILESKGVVDSASNGKEALDHFTKNTYDVVITDLSMPVMGGVEFYKEALKLDQDLSKKIIFFTGMLDKETEEFLGGEGIKYLKKPSHINDIIGAVNEILEDTIKLDQA